MSFRLVNSRGQIVYCNAKNWVSCREHKVKKGWRLAPAQEKKEHLTNLLTLQGKTKNMVDMNDLPESDENHGAFTSNINPITRNHPLLTPLQKKLGEHFRSLIGTDMIDGLPHAIKGVLGPIFLIINKRTERQAHGLNNEDRVKLDYGLLDYGGVTSGYTGKYDAQTKEGVPVSIKTEKIKSDIELGDYFRNAQVNKDFYMVVSFWEEKKDNIVEEYRVKFPVEDWKKLFNHGLDDKIRRVIKEASNDYAYDSIWTQKINELKEEYGNNIIRLRPKRDHKKQKRMQCAISYADFLMLHDKYKTEDIKRNK